MSCTHVQAGEDKLLQEMQDLQETLRRKGRRDKKHKQEAKHKARVRSAQLALSKSSPCILGVDQKAVFTDQGCARDGSISGQQQCQNFDSELFCIPERMLACWQWDLRHLLILEPRPQTQSPFGKAKFGRLSSSLS